MAGRRTNQALLALLPLAGLTGFGCFLVGSGSVSIVVISHAVIGLAIAALTPWKQVIIRRGLRRAGRASGRAGRPPGGGQGWSLLLLVAIVVTLLTGLAHSSGVLVHAFGIRTLQVHVGAALVALVPVLLHVRGRVRRAGRGVGRRDVLRAGALLAGAGVSYAVLEGTARAVGLPGAARRSTGSYERASGDPTAVPATIWLFDSVPTLGAAATLTVTSGGHQRRWRVEQLPVDDEITAVLDCTSGWWSRQTWSGVRVARLLPAGATGSVRVISHTGYRRRLPLTDDLLLATRVGGQPLDAGHGAPVRLVVPGRRGFHWVKWAERIEHDGRPWWLEPPLPPR